MADAVTNKSIADINYAALETFDFGLVLAESAKKTIQSKRFLLLVAAWLVLVLPYLLAAPIVDDPNSTSPYVSFFLLPTALLAGLVSYHFYKIRVSKLQRFAEDNGWKLLRYQPQQTMPYSVSGNSRTHTATTMLEMNIDGTRWDMIMVRHPNEKDHAMTVFRTPIKESRVSPMILDSLRTRTLINIPKSWHKVDLEGNFPKSFKLYMPKGTHIEVLSYMAPDLMHLLYSNNKLNDIEIHNGYLFVQADRNAQSAQSLKQILPTLDLILNKLPRARSDR